MLATNRYLELIGIEPFPGCGSRPVELAGTATPSRKKSIRILGFMEIAPRIKGLGVEHDILQVQSSHALGRYCRRYYRRSCSRVHPFSRAERDKVDIILGPLATELYAINDYALLRRS
jgi:hypothetical protein